MIAKLREIVLILPRWLSFDNGGVEVDFQSLFEVQPFLDSLLRHANVTAMPLDQVPPHFTKWRPSPREGGALAGWRKYKYAHMNPVAFERAVFTGLRPSQRLRERIDAAKRSFFAHGSDSPARRNARYGCLHARIEADMQPLSFTYDMTHP